MLNVEGNLVEGGEIRKTERGFVEKEGWRYREEGEMSERRGWGRSKWRLFQYSPYRLLFGL